MNKLDFDDVVTRGKRKGIARAQAIINKWNQADTEISIGQLIEKIKSDPQLAAAMPANVMKEMEERYGTSTSSTI